MKFLGNFLFWFIIMLFLINISLFIFSYINKNNNNRLSNLKSPLPKLLTSVFGKNVEASDLWQLNTDQAENESNLTLSALSAISYDLTTDKVLFTKDHNLVLPMASLTKIMTAIITLENIELETNMTVTKSASEIGEGTMGLSYGETLTVEELLYGLLLQSGNDAAETLAQQSQFGREGFLHLMNKKAEDIGLINTKFTNPTGLQGDGNQHTSVTELVALTRYALRDETFRKIVSTYQYDIPKSSKHKEFRLFNETNLLTTYPGVKGVKTGFTDEAGMCLVSYLEYKDHKIIAVLLNSRNRRLEMKELLDYSLRQLGEEPPAFNPR